MAALFENFLILLIVLAVGITFLAFGVFCASGLLHYIRKRRSARS